MPDVAVVFDRSNPAPPLGIEFSLCVDTAVFPREVVLRTCYAFTDRCQFWLQSEGESSILIGFRRKEAAADLDHLKGEFGNALIDFGLRASIEANTRTVRDAIVTAALVEAGGPSATRR
ncbi:His-Xaa-Ser system protein HxsD [Azospirillum sp. YIM DDC1]|uniref:His-Xaa-Ser system protein HxsD n=1 Tax=Azospirillum aestuarii TaxID=2802052 RepID=A0ABS1HTI4_9PROT|nr:His-Xaa-Ser system protein HxsD [Azospirillum aestuarii]MBK4717608.1 His-Xaa-Ser system protein HxsD [Azospirillum aestuarii]